MNFKTRFEGKTSKIGKDGIFEENRAEFDQPTALLRHNGNNLKKANTNMNSQ